MMEVLALKIVFIQTHIYDKILCKKWVRMVWQEELPGWFHRFLKRSKVGISAGKAANTGLAEVRGNVLKK